jgi:hypothetical protein
LHELRVSAAGFVPARILFVDAPPPLDIRLEPLPPPRLAEPATPAEEAAAAPAAEASESPPPSTWSERRASAARRKSTSSGRRVLEVPASATKKKPFVQIIEPETPASLSSRSE